MSCPNQVPEATPFDKAVNDINAEKNECMRKFVSIVKDGLADKLATRIKEKRFDCPIFEQSNLKALFETVPCLKTDEYYSDIEKGRRINHRKYMPGFVGRNIEIVNMLEEELTGLTGHSSDSCGRFNGTTTFGSTKTKLVYTSDKSKATYYSNGHQLAHANRYRLVTSKNNSLANSSVRITVDLRSKKV